MHVFDWWRRLGVWGALRLHVRLPLCDLRAWVGGKRTSETPGDAAPILPFLRVGHKCKRLEKRPSCVDKVRSSQESIEKM